MGVALTWSIVDRLLALSLVSVRRIATRYGLRTNRCIIWIGGRQLGLRVTWWRLHNEWVIIDVDIGCCIDVQDSSLAPMASLIMIGCDTISSHHIRYVSTSCPLSNRILSIVNMHITHQLLNILDIGHVVVSAWLVWLVILHKCLRTVRTRDLLCHLLSIEHLIVFIRAALLAIEVCWSYLLNVTFEASLYYLTGDWISLSDIWL